MKKRIFTSLLIVGISATLLTAVILIFSVGVIFNLQASGEFSLTLESGEVIVIGQVLIPIILVTLLVLIISILMTIRFSRRLTRLITDPVIEFVSALERVDSGSGEPVYPEFRPMLDKISFQRKEINRQLERVQKEKNRVATIINNMDEGLIILGSDMRVIMLNEAAGRVLKSHYPCDKCYGLLISEVCPNEQIVRCLENSEAMSFTSDGRVLQLQVKHIVNSPENVGRIGLILDVTERSEIDRIKQEFTANISHELKTPLTSISGYAEMIENGMAKGDDTLLFAGRIRRESARLLSLISDIIKLSRLDSGVGDSFEPINLRPVCEETVEILRDSADKNGIEISLIAEDCTVQGSRNELSELVYNLVDNAIRYNRRNGRIDIRLFEAEVGVRLSVSDNGIGIPDEHKGRVFERFYRVDKSRSKATGGTGLGLAIVKHIAERHDARLTLESEVGKGTTIAVLFANSQASSVGAVI